MWKRPGVASWLVSTFVFWASLMFQKLVFFVGHFRSRSCVWTVIRKTFGLIHKVLVLVMLGFEVAVQLLCSCSWCSQDKNAKVDFLQLAIPGMISQVDTHITMSIFRFMCKGSCSEDGKTLHLFFGINFILWIARDISVTFGFSGIHRLSCMIFCLGCSMTS